MFDVSAAFDRVAVDKLLTKLAATGAPPETELLFEKVVGNPEVPNSNKRMRADRDFAGQHGVPGRSQGPTGMCFVLIFRTPTEILNSPKTLFASASGVRRTKSLLTPSRNHNTVCPDVSRCIFM
eukprot:8140329-Pyramimonas_sp.AAC.1